MSRAGAADDSAHANCAAGTENLPRALDVSLFFAKIGMYMPSERACGPRAPRKGGRLLKAARQGALAPYQTHKYYCLGVSI